MIVERKCGQRPYIIFSFGKQLCFFQMLLKKNADSPGIEKQMLTSLMGLGGTPFTTSLRASMAEGLGEQAQEGPDEVGSDLIPFHLSHFTSIYSHN